LFQKWSKKVTNSEILHIWKVYRISIFDPILMQFFSLGTGFLLSLIVLEINIKSRIPEFELSYFTSNFNAVFCKVIIFMGCWMPITVCFFILKNGLKGTQIQKFHLFGRHITWNSKNKTNVPNTILLYPTHYYVQQFTATIIMLCPLLLLICTFSTFPCQQGPLC
jgi:hypothetical protein